MSFFSGLLGSVGSSFMNSAIGSITSSIGSSLFSAGSSLFSSVGESISGLFSGDQAGSVDHNSLFPDVFESKESVVPSLSVSEPSLNVRGAGDSSFSPVDRFASSFDFDDDSAPVKIPSPLDSLPTLSSDAPLLQLRQPVTDSSQFERLFPSFDASAPLQRSEAKLNYDPGFIEPRRSYTGIDLSVPMSAATLEAAGQADGPNSGRTDGVRNFGADNFRSQVPTFGTMSAPRAGQAFFDSPVTSKNGEAVVGSSPADDLMLKMTLAMPGGAAAKFTADGDRLVTLYRGERWLEPRQVFDPGFASTAVERGIASEQRSYDVAAQISDGVSDRARTGLISTSTEAQRAAQYAQSRTGDGWVYIIEAPRNATQKVGGIDSEVVMRDRISSSNIKGAVRVRQGPNGETQFLDTVLNPFFGK